MNERGNKRGGGDHDLLLGTVNGFFLIKKKKNFKSHAHDDVTFYFFCFILFYCPLFFYKLELPAV